MRNPLLLFSAFNAAYAIRFKPKAELFVPKLLFFSKKDEGPFAITALPFKIEVVRNGYGCRHLLRKISGNRGVRDPFGLFAICARITVRPRLSDNGLKLRDDFLVSRSIPVKVYVPIRRTGIQARNVWTATVSGVVDELRVLVGLWRHWKLAANVTVNRAAANTAESQKPRGPRLRFTDCVRPAWA